MDNKYTNIDIFSQNECPSDALLLSYVKETISEEDKRKVELHMVDCDMCRDMVEGYQSMESANIDSNIKSIEVKIDEAVAAHNKRRGAASFKWYYAAAAILIIGLTGILYNFYFNSLDQTKVADLPMPHQNEISVVVDTAVTNEVKDSAINSSIKSTTAEESLQSEYTESKNRRIVVQEEEISVAESSMDEMPPPPVEQVIAEKETVAEDAAKPTKSITDNSTSGKATLIQPAFTGSPNTEVITNGATPYFTSPSNNLSTVTLEKSESKKINFSLKKQSSGKSKFKAKESSAAATEVEKDKQEEFVVVNKANSDTTNMLQEANQLLREKKYNEAIPKFNQYLQSAPKSCDAVNGIAQCYDITNKIPEAILNYNKLTQLKCGKTSDTAYLKLGALYLKNKQADEAKQFFQKAMQSKYLDIAEQAKKELDKL